jgi:thioredoxin 1
MICIATLAELNKILDDNTLVIVDFYSENCPPCKKIGPIFEKLSQQLHHIAFVKVDCGNRNEIAPAYKVGAVPTFIFFKHKKAVHTHHGANEKELHDVISKYFD